MQSRALGARIIDLLTSQDDSPLITTTGSPRSHSSSANVSPDSSARSSPQPQSPSRRKRRVIIHTSPYLRCLQTAIAVSSGISQYHPSPKSDPVGASTGRDGNADATPDVHRSLLRVDAFLGEWLSPDYFEDITPPPSSERLIGAAKAELLRRSVNTVPQADITNKQPTGYFPGGWGSTSTPTSPIREAGPPPTNAIARGQRSRAGSCDALNSAHSIRPKGLLSRINTNLSSIPDDSAGSYVPPTPSYAIAPSDPIPAGYVTHARNACANVDYQWDSMRTPQSWGDGGNYGEEWSAMHARFRNGLENMVEWYQENDNAQLNPQQPLDGYEKDNGKNEDDSDDAVETVLVLITHGAGCNAMVGALTGEPVLLDFNTASLTMAVREDASEDTPGVKPRYRSASDPSRLLAYDLKLAASVDHLRPPAKHTTRGGSSTLSSPVTLSSPSVPSYRHRATSRSSLSQGQFIIGPSTPGLNSQPLTNGRPSTAPRGASGLWGSNSTSGDDSTDDIVPNFGNPIVSNPSADRERSVKHRPEEASTSWGNDQVPQRTLSQRGLWGSAPLKTDRTDVKRRWTVTERRV